MSTRIIIQIPDQEIADIYYNLPKLMKNRLVLAALTDYIASKQGQTVIEFFRTTAPKTSWTAKPDSTASAAPTRAKVRATDTKPIAKAKAAPEMPAKDAAQKAPRTLTFAKPALVRERPVPVPNYAEKETAKVEAQALSGTASIMGDF